MFSALFVKSSLAIQKYVNNSNILFSHRTDKKKEDKACLYKSVVVHKGVHVSVCTPAWVCAFESLMSMYYVRLTKIV